MAIFHNFGRNSLRQLTGGGHFHWRGYYDKLLFSADDRYILASQVTFEDRSPLPTDEIRIGMIDTHHNDAWTDLGKTTAWNWQQAAMLQFLPNSKNEIIYNDREADHYVSHILNLDTGKRRTLPAPVYALSADGKTAISTDFRRLNDCRPGYGYAGIPDPNAAILAPKDAGIWRTNLRTGDTKLILSLHDVASIPYHGPEETAIRPTSKHWFNHLLFNTGGGGGTRFWFLHRWHAPGDKFHFNTRAFTADIDGRNLYCLDPHGSTSHFIWRDENHVTAWAWHPSHGNAFYTYTDRTDIVEVVGKDLMTRNGHNTYVPNTSNEWILNDTYPAADTKLQTVYLYHIPTNRRIDLAHLPAPYPMGERRCDLHPTASRDGTKVVIDSAHDGGRQLYVIDIGSIVKS